MPLDARHARVSAVPDNGDPDLIQGPDWNAAHVLLQGPAALLGRADSAPGQAPTVEVSFAALPALIGSAPLNSPVFTGDPKAPTPPLHDNDTSIPTTAWVQGELGFFLPKTGGTLTGDLVISHAGNTVLWIDSSDVGGGRPGFALTKQATLEGFIQADGLAHGQIYYQAMSAGGLHEFFVNGVAVGIIQPAPATTDNSITIATTAWVKALGYSTLASPTFTGDPKAPTPATADSDTSIATTAYVKAQGYMGVSAVTIANTMPGVGSPQVLDVAAGTGTWYTIGQMVWVQDIGYCSVYAVNANQVGIINLGHATNVIPTTAIPIGKRIVPAGPIANEVSQNLSGISVTLKLQDAGRHIYHQAGSAAATYTIPDNATVAFPIGSAVQFVNDSTNAVTIAITTDTLAWSPSGATGSRTLAQFGVATALKVTATRWIISGFGLT
jgi:hypothetical protein